MCYYGNISWYIFNLVTFIENYVLSEDFLSDFIMPL